MLEATIYVRDDNARGYSKLTVLRTNDDDMVSGLERIARILERTLGEDYDNEPEVVRVMLRLVDVVDDNDVE